MARYIILQEKDFEEVNRYFGLTIDGFKSIAEGSGNSSYLCTADDENLIVTVFEEKTFLEVSQISELLKYLDKNGFFTSKIISPVENVTPVMALLGKPVLVKEYIPGEMCIDKDEIMLEQVGRAMGDLHQIQAPDFLRRDHAYGLQIFNSVIGVNIDPAYEEWLAGRYDYLDRNIPEGLPLSLIHGDIFEDNVLVNGGQFQAIIDFEEACNYYRVFDVGMGIVGMCREEGKVRLDRARAIVGGYQQVQELDDIEINSLQLFVEYAAVATSYWRFWKFNIHEPIKEKARHHMKMVEIANQVRAIPADEFMRAVF